MHANDVPAGKKLFYEDGRAFYYELGYRVYVEGAEMPAQARRLAADELDRIVSCTGCGAWIDAATSDAIHLEFRSPELYSRKFFERYHRKECRSATQTGPYFSSAEPVIPAGLKWDPSSCADFVPFSDAVVRHHDNLHERLCGNWRSDKFCHFARLSLSSDGSGTAMDWTTVDPRIELDWNILGPETLGLKLKSRAGINGVLETLFDPQGVEFELITFKEPYGKTEDYLLVYSLTHQRLLVFQPETSSDATIKQSWANEESFDEGIRIFRLSSGYLAKFFRAAQMARMITMTQIRLVRERAERDAFVRDDRLENPNCDDSSFAEFQFLERGIGNLWVMLELAPDLFSHLRLPNGYRFACLFDKFRRDETISGHSRITLIDSSRSPSLEEPPIELRHADLTGPLPGSAPDWITWWPSDAIVRDNAPAFFFEKFMLEQWTARLFTPGTHLDFHGIVFDNASCFFPDGTVMALPEKLFLTGDVRPLVAFVSGSVVPDAFIPNASENRNALRCEPFVYMEFYCCSREAQSYTPPLAGEDLVSTSRTRVWITADGGILTESDRIFDIRIGLFLGESVQGEA